MKEQLICLDDKGFRKKTAEGLFVFLFCFITFSSCVHKKSTQKFVSKDISDVITTMTNIMLHDITNPPLCTRFFSYATLAGYEIVAENNNKFKTMRGMLNGYPVIKKPDSISVADYQLAALLAVMETAKKMQPSGKVMDAYEQHFIDSCQNIGVDSKVIDDSKRYAVGVSKQILAYAKADGYNKISNLPRYTPLSTEGHWFPTPPGFMAAVEPYFNTVRSFTLDSCSQFKPVPPVTFSADSHSPFYKITEAVYQEGKSLPLEHRVIASFWDCNPYAMQDAGHLQYGFKKISPGSHWLGITGIACLDAKKSFDESMQIFTVESMGLMDAFICCWDEKYRSNRIRPETAIRKYIDPGWAPLLQTPPFPEYVSGHSVVSASSAVILTHYFGENFGYRDSVEVSYGIPARDFKSFKLASDEAGVSRFYGGIHFMDAINNGQQVGTGVGEWVLGKLKLK